MAQILDFSKSITASFSQSISIPIVASPSSNTLAQFGLTTGTGGNVWLDASVGTQTTLGSPDLLFTILRGSTAIFSITASALSINQFDPISFSFVDSNLTAGYFAYTLTVSQVNSAVLNSANLVGPVLFSGLSLV
ncbi:hypothetical protein [Paenibacillus graminis]|uniref:hypothetical protein n=1 Tax=Paenibacillus graminis TaxID=189425 RepID=UPI002DBEEC13|nr:hypothetical protein [Paenibacillus graminis]MEC0172084.1 hypothetical protein [Paenibacillus graminis]